MSREEVNIPATAAIMATLVIKRAVDELPKMREDWKELTDSEWAEALDMADSLIESMSEAFAHMAASIAAPDLNEHGHPKEEHEHDEDGNVVMVHRSKPRLPKFVERKRKEVFNYKRWTRYNKVTLIVLWTIIAYNAIRLWGAAVGGHL